MRIDGRYIYARDWPMVQKAFVSWLVKDGYLNDSHLPIRNASGGKNYIASEPPWPYYGDWKEVENGVYVDTKYNGEAQMQNMAACLRQLHLEEVDIAIFERNNQHINLFQRWR